MADTGSLTAMDIIVLLLVGGGIVFGVIRGFVTEVLSLMAWVAAVMALRLFYTPASAWAAEFTGTDSGGAVLAFAGLFFGAFIVFRIIANQLGSRTRQSVVGPIDRLLGGGFGALKGLIGASLLFLAVNLGHEVIWGEDDPPEWVATSKTSPLLKLSSRLIVDFVEERRDAARDGEKAAKQPSDPARKNGKKTEGKRHDREDGKGYSPSERQNLEQLLDAANALDT